MRLYRLELVPHMKKKLIFVSLILSGGLLAGCLSFALNKTRSEPIKKAEAATYTQSVTDYYSGFNWNLTGANLKTALFNKINISTAGWSYDGLWDAYKTTDVRPDGTHFWDIYADSTDYTLNDKRINASYKKEGDSINREHVIPQSSFNEKAPMKSDIHHVLPSDGYVNNRRSAYPHGIVTGSVTYTSNDGCKLGTGTGNSTVFEPMDQYKGDIARIYFYFVTCYQGNMSSNSFSAFDKSTYPSIKTAYLNVYLQWAKEDPVSQKEIDRNNAAYAGQGNRNPFIDCPYAVGAIWDSSHATDYGNKGEIIVAPQGSTGITSISKTTASIVNGNSTTISATSSNSETISWSSSNTNVATVSSPTAASGSNITINAVGVGTSTITASITISGTTYSKTCAVTVTAPKTLSSISVSGQKTSFVVNSSFSFGGTVTAHYSDSTTADVTESATFTGYNMATLGNQTVTVSYTEGTTKTTTYQITVSEASQPLTYNTSFSYSEVGSTWSLTNYTSGNGFIYCPDNNNEISVALFEDVFSDKNIISNVVVSMNIATYGSGNNPTSATFKIYNSSACSTQVSATQGGTLPSSSSYTDATYTISQSTASASFSDDLAIKITKTGKQIRIKTINITFSYTTGSITPTPTVSDVTVTPSTLELDLNGSTSGSLSALVSGTNSPAQTVTWFSDDTAVASVNNNGVVTAVAVGTATITATSTVDTTKSGTCTVTVIDTTPKTLTLIDIDEYITSLEVGSSFTFGGVVIALYSDDSEEDVTSSATFSGYDMSTAGVYIVTVSYTYEGVTRTTSYTLTVTNPSGGDIVVTNHSFKEVDSVNELKNGSKIALVSYYETNESYYASQVYSSGNFLTAASVQVIDDALAGTFETYTLGLSNSDKYTFKDSNDKYLAATSSTKNYMGVESSVSSNSTWNISLSNSLFDISATGTFERNQMRFNYNDGNPRFSCYGSATSIDRNMLIFIDVSEVVADFINSYLYMTTYTNNLGYCNDNTHHYYQTAKDNLLDLGEKYITEFKNNDDFNAAQARYEAWASFNGDATPYYDSGSNSASLTHAPTNSVVTTITVLTLCTLSISAIYLALKHRKFER